MNSVPSGREARAREKGDRMTRILISCLIVILAAGPAAAEHAVGIFSDSRGLNCNIYDNSPTLFSVYVVHYQGYYPEGASGIRFKAPVPLCATGVSWVSDQPMFGTTVGGSQTGAVVFYGSLCVWSTVAVMRINLMGNGLSETCCPYPVEPISGHQYIEVIDCHNNSVEALPRDTRINPDFLCDCTGWTPVQGETWGRIKALYQ